MLSVSLQAFLILMREGLEAILVLVTSMFLLAMAARLTGAGLQEFQEQAVLPYTPVALPDRAEAIGLATSWEGLAAQALVLLGAVAVMLWLRRAPAPGDAEGRDGSAGTRSVHPAPAGGVVPSSKAA